MRFQHERPSKDTTVKPFGGDYIDTSSKESLRDLSRENVYSKTNSLTRDQARYGSNDSGLSRESSSKSSTISRENSSKSASLSRSGSSKDNHFRSPKPLVIFPRSSSIKDKNTKQTHQELTEAVNSVFGLSNHHSPIQSSTSSQPVSNLVVNTQTIDPISPNSESGSALGSPDGSAKQSRDIMNMPGVRQVF